MAKSISRRLADSASPTGAIDGTLSTAAQTNITSLGTLSALTVSGDLTVDTSTLKVDSTNNRVGIGTSSPAGPLDVVSSSGAVGAYIRGRSSDNIGSVYFTSNASASTEYGYVQGSSSDLRIQGFNNGLILQPSSGNVGIGTSSPSTYAKFAIRGGLTVSAGSTSLTGTSFSTSDAANSTFWINHANATTNLITDVSMAFYTASGSGVAERMRITSAGYVKIGNTGGSGILNVNNGANDGGYVHFANNVGSTTLTNDQGLAFGWNKSNGGGESIIIGNQGAGSVGGLVFATNTSGGSYAERMRIDSSGNVGIGTDAPGNQLEIFKAGEGGAYRIKVKGDTGHTGIEIENTASSNTNLLFRNPSYTQELYMDAAGKFHVYNNSIHRFTVDQGGNVGIGTAAPVQKLHLEGTTASIHVQSTAQNQNSSIYFNSNVGGAQATRWEIGTNISAGADLEFFDRINSASRMVVKSNGNVGIIDGNLAFASGHGIDFSASANYSGGTSELLDDYEEGLWYPYLGTDTQLGSPASSNYNSHYVKVGRLVKCTGYFNSWNYANVTSGTYMMIRNLPFPPVHHDIGLRVGYADNIGGSNYGYGNQAYNGFYLMLGGSIGTSPIHYLRSAAPASGAAYAMITVTYYTAS